MKITVDIEATAQEMREFLGLPNVQPLQDEVMDTILENMKHGVTGFDAMTLMKPMLPAQMQSMETLQKAFWDAFAKASSGQESKTKDGKDRK